LAVLTALAIRGWHAFGFVRDRVEFFGRAEHVHIDGNRLAVTRRPDPQPRVIPWKSVRYLGADARSFFVVAGAVPVVVPRRAFATTAAWHEFVEAAARYAQSSATRPSRGLRRQLPYGRTPGARRARNRSRTSPGSA
jgi:hypothetical protein